MLIFLVLPKVNQRHSGLTDGRSVHIRQTWKSLVFMNNWECVVEQQRMIITRSSDDRGAKLLVNIYNNKGLCLEQVITLVLHHNWRRSEHWNLPFMLLPLKHLQHKSRHNCHSEIPQIYVVYYVTHTTLQAIIFCKILLNIWNYHRIFQNLLGVSPIKFFHNSFGQKNNPKQESSPAWPKEVYTQ